MGLLEIFQQKVIIKLDFFYISDGSKFYAKKNDSMSKNDRSIDDIKKQKSIKYLYFSACNTANIDIADNIISAFYKKNPNVRNVTGWDGGLAFVFKSSNPFFKENQDYPTADDNQFTFYTFRANGAYKNRKPGKRSLIHQYYLPAK